MKDGGVAELPLKAEAFHYHPNNEREPTDVAVAPVNTRHIVEGDSGKERVLDIRTLLINGENSFAPTETFIKESMGLGAEIVIVGLFRSHYGKNRNIPVIRVGNIAARPEEPVWTKYAGQIEAYLIEARSIAGLSGSPVFGLMETARAVVHSLTTGGQFDGQTAALMGLVHGHFDVKNLNEDVVTDDVTSVHTGMGVVIPFQKILETVEHPDLMAIRKTYVSILRKEEGATPDLAPSDHAEDAARPANADNPTHQEDFTSLLDAAARTQKRDR